MGDEFATALENLPQEKFDQCKASLVEQILRPDERLAGETSRWWAEITTFQFYWKRRVEEASIMDSLTKADMNDFFANFVSRGAPKRRQLVTAVFAAGKDMKSAMEKLREAGKAAGATFVDDPQALCRSLPLW